MTEAVSKRPWKKWEPSYWSLFKAFLLSNGVQTAIQLATGALFVQLFSLVPQLRFPRSCLATIFFLGADLVVAQDNHTGSHIFAGAVWLGELTYGVLYAGFALMLAHAPGVAYTTFLCIFSAIFFIPLAMLRAEVGSPALPLNLGFAFTIINGQSTWGAKKLWTQVLVPGIYVAMVTAGGCLAAALVLYTTLASSQLRVVLSDTLSDVGMAVSGYASHILVPPGIALAAVKRDDTASMHLRPGKGQVPIGPASRKGPHPELMSFLEEPVLKRYYEDLWKKTNPATDHSAVRIAEHGTDSVLTLLPRIQLCRRLVTEAMAEPPFLSRHRLQLKYWSAAISALERFMLRVASLESVLASLEPVLQGYLLEDALGVDMLPMLRVLYATIAANCGSLASAVKYRKGLQRMDDFGRLFQSSWSTMEAQLAEGMRIALRSRTWSRKATLTIKPLDPAGLQVRALLYVVTLTNDIMKGMSELETAWEAAAAHQYTMFHFFSRTKRHYRRDPAGKAVKESQMQETTAATLKQVVVQPRESISSRAPADADSSVHSCMKEMLGDLDRCSVASAAAARGTHEHQRDPLLQQLQQEEDEEEEDDALSQLSARSPRASSDRRMSRTFSRVSDYSGHSNASGGPRSRRQIRRSVSSVRPPPKTEQEFRDATDTADDMARPSDSPLPATDLSAEGPKPWQWSKDWMVNEVAFIKFVAPVVLAFNLFHSGRTIVQHIAHSCSSLQLALHFMRRNRKWQFFVKFWLLSVGCLVIILALQANYVGVRAWAPLYTMFTVVVVLSERVETTVYKGCFRLFGNVLGGIIGWLVMHWSVSAKSPYIIAAVNCTWVALAAFIAMKAQWRYGVFLMLSTTLGITLCQYQPHAPPGFTGASLAFYSRLATIGLGLLLVLMVDILVLPWYTSESVMETLGAGFQDGCNLLWDLHEMMQYKLSLPGDEPAEEKPEVAGHEREALEQVGRRLAETQTMLEKEVVLWKHGFLAIPKIVYTCQSAMRGLLVRLVAVEATLLQGPSLTGQFSPSLYHWIAQPLRSYMNDAADAVSRVGATVSALLGGDERGHVEYHLTDHDEAVLHLVHYRLEMWSVYTGVVRRFHAAMLRGDCPPRNPDDAVRWLSYVYAFSEAVDKIILFANCVRANQFIVDRCKKRTNDVKLRSWLGLKPRHHNRSVDVTKPPMREPKRHRGEENVTERLQNGSQSQ